MTKDTKAWTAFVLIAAWGVLGCSREPEKPAERPPALGETSQPASEQSPGDQRAAAASSGAVFGKVIFKGKPQPQTISVSRDQEVCGQSKPDPTMILSPQGEVQNAVVYIKSVQGGKTAEPLRRSDFSRCTSCEPCSGYGQGPQTTLTAETLMASLHELIAAAPDLLAALQARRMLE